MAFYLEKQETSSTPYILIDEANSRMKMSGTSYPEKTVEFFSEVNTWLDNYLCTDFGAFTFDFALEYYNI
ncbi:MAG: DUF1987 domain-containing protein [Defluviitaleaceae bacterium]|nr:DUF1987 domain-containing protein [Defluviitaleaceae bacterium]MCL2836502.1 DUF1987 domain-containing protein [Defluviitaleaceae bacterium]